MNIRPQNIARYEKAEKLFNEGKSLRTIGQELKMDYRYISQYLKEKGYLIVRNQQWIKNDDDTLKKGEQMFLQGIGINKASKILGIKDNRLSNFLQEKGHTITMNNQQHIYYEDMFEVIDTEEKAYWLGFISADGSITNGILEISLKESDKQHLDKFAKFISPTVESVPRLKQKAYRVTVCSKKICEDLIRLGVTERKSLTLEFCNQLPDDMIHHYIRGYLDGDGSIGIRTDSQGYVILIGTEQFLDSVIDRLRLHRNKKGRYGNAFFIRYSGNKSSRKMLDQLYDDSNIYLPRKYDRYQQIVSHCRSAKKLAEV